MNTRNWVAAGTIIGVLVGSPMAVMSHGKAKGIVLERHNVMSDIGDAVKVINAMIRGKRELDRAEMAARANVISDGAGRIGELFPDNPESRRGAGSSATPSVWNDKARFDAIGQDLASAAENLAGVATTATSEELKMRVREMGATCKSCHKDFRKKKKKKH